MLDQPWQDIAREWVAPWSWCVLSDGRTSGVKMTGRLGTPGGKVYTVRTKQGTKNITASMAFVDLTHPPTAREAVARLALVLGAPEEVVAEGVVFHCDRNTGWWNLLAGPWETMDVGTMPGWWAYDLARDIPADQRPLAIALAWREARMAKGARDEAGKPQLRPGPDPSLEESSVRTMRGNSCCRHAEHRSGHPPRIKTGVRRSQGMQASSTEDAMKLTPESMQAILDKLCNGPVHEDVHAVAGGITSRTTHALGGGRLLSICDPETGETICRASVQLVTAHEFPASGVMRVELLVVDGGEG